MHFTVEVLRFTPMLFNALFGQVFTAALVTYDSKHYVVPFLFFALIGITTLELFSQTRNAQLSSILSVTF